MLLALLAATGADLSPEVVVSQLFERVQANDQAAYSAMAPDLQWELVDGLTVPASFKDVSMFVEGCAPFKLGEQQPAETDGSMTVSAAATCRDDDAGPKPMTFEFTVRDGKVLSFSVKEAN